MLVCSLSRPSSISAYFRLTSNTYSCNIHTTSLVLCLSITRFARDSRIERSIFFSAQNYLLAHSRLTLVSSPFPFRWYCLVSHLPGLSRLVLSCARVYDHTLFFYFLTVFGGAFIGPSFWQQSLAFLSFRSALLSCMHCVMFDASFELSWVYLRCVAVHFCCFFIHRELLSIIALL